LLIILDGSGFNSVIRDSKVYSVVDFVTHVLPPEYSKYTIFIPEKFNRDIGQNYFHDMEERERYTIENLVVNYQEVISEYLVQNNFESIVMLGASEGAIILPLVYSRLNNPNITALISIASGGLSLFELIDIYFERLFSDTDIVSELDSDTIADLKTVYENLYQRYLEMLHSDSIKQPPIIRGFEHVQATYRWGSSIAFIRPFDYYKNINIPVLFIHGEIDVQVLVESTRYVEKNLPDKPFEYIYYPNMGHSPRSWGYGIIQRDIKRWLEKIDP
jgi:pimeloyl-ACP methyl ester carboxylesterase